MANANVLYDTTSELTRSSKGKIDVDAKEMYVPGGEDAYLLVKLTKRPAKNTTVRVKKEEGRGFAVKSGEKLTFTKDNWNTFQVVIFKSEMRRDSDDDERETEFLLTADGYDKREVTLKSAESDDNPNARIVVDSENVSVPVGKEAILRARLSKRPKNTVTAQVITVQGEDIIVKNGQTLTFTGDNWRNEQAVTFLSKGETLPNNEVTFLLYAPGYPKVEITAKETGSPIQPPITPVIKTSAANLIINEGQSGMVDISLSSPPVVPVTLNVVRSSGDPTLAVTAGSALTFDATNYNTPQTVTITATEDGIVSDGAAVFTISGDSLEPIQIGVTKKDATPQQILIDATSVDIPEGGKLTIPVKLLNQPADSAEVTISKVSGPSDVSVAEGQTLTFTPSTYSQTQNVVIESMKDSDGLSQTIFRLATATAPSVDLTVTEVAGVSGEVQPVVVDPVTRIEGHLRIETMVRYGTVDQAWSTATLYRGVENILKGRDPMDAPLITQRLCGVCTYIHMQTASQALENAFDVSIPQNAQLVRNLLLGIQFVHDHIVHFYHLHMPDWVDVSTALAGDPAVAQSMAPAGDPTDYHDIKAKLAGVVESGQLGPFNSGNFGHPAYRFNADESLYLVGHYITALRKQAEFAKAMALIGGKNPHPQTVVVGGVTCGQELASNDVRATLRNILVEARDFVENIYMPDLEMVANKYSDWSAVGGFNNLLAYGEFIETDGSRFLPRGQILDGNPYAIYEFGDDEIVEHVSRSHYQGDTARHPYDGETSPEYGGESLDGKYSWSKAPRLAGMAHEVGPLARVMVAYGLGHPDISSLVNGFSARTGIAPEAMFSVLGRTVARGLESISLANANLRWLDQLESNLASGVNDIFTGYNRPASARGYALGEAPRGALGHWLESSGGKLDNYQLVVPSTWNFGPRDAAGNAGPVEQSLVGVPVADADRPVEVVRAVHSFDPCIACGVHLIEPETGKQSLAKIL